MLGAAAEGVAKAAKLLAGQYTLVATNVPYLTRGSQDSILMDYCSLRHPEAKSDLATAFMERCRAFAAARNSYAIVVPQNSLSLSSYEDLRKRMLREQAWHHVSWLGPRAFETIGGEVVNPALLILSNQLPGESNEFSGLDVSSKRTARDKARSLTMDPLSIAKQSEQMKNPEARIILEHIQQSTRLQDYAHGVHGLGTKDSPRFIRCFWEVPTCGTQWEFMQSSVEASVNYGGLEHIVFWEQGQGILHRLSLTGDAILAGSMAHGKPGVLVSQVGGLSCTLYVQGLFEKSAAVVLPHDPTQLRAIWEYCKSADYNRAVRLLDRKTAVTNSTLVKVPFDLDYWQSIADAARSPPRTLLQ